MDFVGASLFGTPLQIPFQGILRFAKASHPSHFGLRPSCYTKSASWILLAVQAEQLHFKSAKCTFSIPFGFHIGAFRKLTFAPCYVKSAILKIPSGSLILNFAFETLKRFQSLRQSFALAHFVRFHLTSVLRNFAILSLLFFLLFLIFIFNFLYF